MSLTTVNYKTSSRCSDNMETTTITTHEKSTEQKLLTDALNRKNLLTFSRTEQIFSIRPFRKPFTDSKNLIAIKNFFPIY